MQGSNIFKCTNTNIVDNDTCIFKIQYGNYGRPYDWFPGGLIYIYIFVHVCVSHTQLYIVYIHVVKEVALHMRL